METNTQTPETGTPAEPEMVQVEEASMEDLDAFIAESQAQEQQPVTATTQKQETKPADATPEPEAEETPPAQDEPPAEEVSRAEVDRIKRQLDGLELLTKRRTSELAEVKQTLKAFIDSKSQGLEEKMSTNPVEATDDLMSIREAKKQLQQVDQETMKVEAMKSNQEAVLKHVNLEETPITSIAEAFLADGIDPQVVAQFKANPWLVPATTTIQAAKRVKAEGFLRVLVPEFKKLKAENDRLKGKGGSDPLKKIEAAARNIPGINGGSGGASASKDESIDNIPFHEMSPKQLDAYLLRASRNKD